MIRWLLFFALASLPAFAGEVTIEWEAYSGAAQYELQVRDTSKVVFDRKFPAAIRQWKASLPVGTYSHRLRVVRSSGRMGPWSEATPFLVTPASPQLLVPLDKGRVILTPEAALTLSWTGEKGVSRYLVEIRGGSLDEPYRKVASAAQIAVTGLPAGSYSWTVKPILEIRKQGENQVLDGKTSMTRTFSLERVKASRLTASGIEEEGPYKYELGAGLILGLDYYLPSLSARIKLTSHLCGGLRFIYASSASDTSSLKSYGLQATATYYLGRFRYEGFYGEGGIGAYLFSATNGVRSEGGRGAPSVYLSGGWQWRPADWPFSFSIAAGAQLVADPRITVVGTTLKGLLPFLSTSLVFSF